MIHKVQIPPSFVKLCQEWHSGVDSMIYAIASTGNLTPGTIRPYNDLKQREMTDEEWYIYLFELLLLELKDIKDNDIADFAEWVEHVLDTMWRLHEQDI